MKSKTQGTVETTDLGLATVLVVHGFDLELNDRNGRVYFTLSGIQEKLRKIESSYWDGSLKMSARDLLEAHKATKGRLYNFKDRAKKFLAAGEHALRTVA